MTMDLIAGQNVPCDEPVVSVRVDAPSPVDVGALLLDSTGRVRNSDDFVFYNQRVAAGVTLSGNGVLTVDFAAVDDTVGTVLCIVSGEDGLLPVHDVTVTVTRPDGNLIAHFCPATAQLGAVITIELYRRGSRWKLRAVGQGYATGLADLVIAHGVEVDDPPVQAAVATPVTGPAVVPLDPSRVLERAWMIFEDGARSASAFASAVEYADERLTDELSVIAADPSSRNSPAGAAERAAAQRRHDALVAAARENHLRDSRQLTDELDAIDPDLPASMASWSSSAWAAVGTSVDCAAAVRVGELTSSERGPLRLPLCLAWPFAQPMWFTDDTGGVASGPAVTGLLLRAVAASPRGRTEIDVIDPGAGLAVVAAELGPLLTRRVSESADVTQRLDELARSVDLWHMAFEAGEPPPAGHPLRRVLVLAGLPYGYGSGDLGRIAYLTGRGPAAGLSTVVIGGVDTADIDPLIVDLAARSQHLPVDGSSPLFDPWVRRSWTFVPDEPPTDPTVKRTVIRELSGF